MKCKTQLKTIANKRISDSQTNTNMLVKLFPVFIV